MNEIEFNIGILLRIILKTIKKSQNLLAKKYILKDASLVSRWINLHTTPKEEELEMVVSFVLKEAKKNQVENLCNIIKDRIKGLPLDCLDIEIRNELKNILDINDYTEFLNRVLNASLLSCEFNGGQTKQKRKKRREPKKYDMFINQISDEIIACISCTAARLDYLDAFEFSDNDFEKRMKNIRMEVYPSMERDANAGYKKLIALQSIEALRQTLNSLPLRFEFEPLLIDLSVKVEVDPIYIRSFYIALGKLKSRYDTLLSWLGQAAHSDDSSNNTYNFYQEVNKLHVYIISNTSKILYFYGLLTLGHLGLTCKDIKSRLYMWTSPILGEFYVRDENWISDLENSINELEKSNNDYCRAVDEIIKARDYRAVAYGMACKQPEINPWDTYDIVTMKAIFLRQSGKLIESVAAFSRFGEMFEKTAPAASLYSKVAQMFTVKIDFFGVKYGLFVCESGDNIGSGNSLEVGDIIIQINDCSIMDTIEFINTLKNTTSNTPVKLKYLRLKNDVEFSLDILEINNWPSGISFMPI